MLPYETACDTNGLMPAGNSIESRAGNGNGFVATVKGRVPRALAKQVTDEVVRRQKLFSRASAADVLRDALTAYFRTRKANGKAGA